MGELSAVLLDVLGVPLLEFVRDGLVVDERKDVLLVVSGIDGVADDVGALEQMRFEVVQREGHIISVLTGWHRLCGARDACQNQWYGRNSPSGNYLE